MAVAVVATYVPYVFTTGIGPVVLNFTGVTAGNLMVMIGTRLLNVATRASYVAEGWTIVEDPGSDRNDVVLLWFALKVANGSEAYYIPYPLYYDGACPGFTNNSSYVLGVELSGAVVGYEWDVTSGTGVGVDPISFAPVTMLGPGLVIASAVTANGQAVVTIDPAGYTDLDQYHLDNCPNEESISWYKVVATGTETPGASDDLTDSWYTLTLGIYGLEANVLETAILELVPTSFSTPVSNGTDEGVDDDNRAPDEILLPPEPSGLVIPGPTWIEP